MKIIIEKHLEGYVAYPAGVQGVVVGQGNTFEEALSDVQSAIRFHIETFGREALESESPALDAFVAEQDPLLLDPNDLRSESVNTGGIIE